MVDPTIALPPHITVQVGKILMVTTPTMPLQQDMDIQVIDENVLSSIDRRVGDEI